MYRLHDMCVHVRLVRARTCAAAAAAATPAATSPAFTSFALACATCNNTDARAFDVQYAEGDIACIKCGTVAVDHALFTGVAERTFEDDEPSDAPKQHAAFPSPYEYLFSDEHATRSSSSAKWKHLAYTCDVHLLRFQTSTRCRDADKQHAIDDIEHAAVLLNTPKAACREAIEMFARLRDVYQRLVTKRFQQVACLLVCHVAHQWVRPVVPKRCHDNGRGTIRAKPTSTMMTTSTSKKRPRRREPSPDWLILA